MALFWWSRHTTPIQTAEQLQDLKKAAITATADKQSDPGLAERNPYTKEQIDEIISRPMPAKK